MGRYTTKMISDKDYKELVLTIREGYIDDYGHKHYPNPQIATILILQNNLGCRIGDIVALRTDSFVWDGEAYRLAISEQKTGKKRPFLIPTPVKEFIDKYIELNHITEGRLFDIECPAVWKCLRQVTEYLGLDKISCHSMRKSAAMRVYTQSNYDISLTSQFLNHSDTKTSLLYLRRSGKQLDDAISKSVCLV